MLPWKQQRTMCDEIGWVVLRLAHSPDYGIPNAEGNRISNDLILDDGKGYPGV